MFNLKPTIKTFVLGTVLLTITTAGSLLVYSQIAQEILALGSTPIHSPITRTILTTSFVLLTLLAGAHIYGHRKLLTTKSKTVLITGLLAVIIIFAAGLSQPPLNSSDSYWYTLSSRGWVEYGLNPYANSPTQLTNDPLYSKIDPFNDHPNPYGPIATLTAALPVLIFNDPEAQALGMRMLSVLAYALAGLVLFRSLKRRAKSKNQAYLFAAFWFLNPYAVFEIGNAGHNEGLLVLALAFFVAGLLEKRPDKALPGIIAAILIKTWPLVLLPSLIILKRRRRGHWIRGLLISVFLFMTYLPFMGGEIGISGLIHQLSYSNPHFFGPDLCVIYLIASKLPQNPESILLVTKIMAGITALVAMTLFLWVTVKKYLEPHWLPFLLMLVFICLTPWLQPWYFLAALPLMALLKPHQMAIGFTAVAVIAFFGYSAAWIVVAILGLTALAVALLLRNILKTAS